MTDERVLRRAVEHYGAAKQLTKAVEELAELQQALCKLMNIADDATTEDYIALVDHITEETADVEIMLAQLRMIFTGLDMSVRRWRSDKVRRLAARLNEEASGDDA